MKVIAASIPFICNHSDEHKRIKWIGWLWSKCIAWLLYNRLMCLLTMYDWVFFFSLKRHFTCAKMKWTETIQLRTNWISCCRAQSPSFESITHTRNNNMLNWWLPNAKLLVFDDVKHAKLMLNVQPKIKKKKKNSVSLSFFQHFN